MFWWQHNTQMVEYSPVKAHRTLQDVPVVEIPQNIDDYKISNEVLEGLNPEVFNGI